MTFNEQLAVLNNIFESILNDQSGNEFLLKVKTLIKKAESVSSNNEMTYITLKEEIKKLEPSIRRKMIRAISIYMQLISIVEHHDRAQYHYLNQESLNLDPLTFENTMHLFKEHNHTSEKIKALFDQLSLELVITAHPTEASRRTVLEIRKRISGILRQLGTVPLSITEKEHLQGSLYEEILILWQTDVLRFQKPTVMDEVRHGIRYFDETLFDILPEIHQELENNLSKTYDLKTWTVPNFIHFGSWIGGDRDGNPFVTSDITWQTLCMQRSLLLKKYEETLVELMKRLSYSLNCIDIELTFLEKIENDENTYLKVEKKWPVKTDIYRRKLQVMLERIRSIGSKNGYESPLQLVQDLQDINKCLKSHQPIRSEHKVLQKLIRQVELFGFHLIKLDIRNHSGEHEAAVAELLKVVQITNSYEALYEEEKINLLKEALKDPRQLTLPHQQYTEETLEMLNVFQMIKKAHEEFGKQAIEVYIISKAQSVSDVLEVMLLAKEAGIYRVYPNGQVESDIDIAPLFETIQDLVQAPTIMDTLFRSNIYQNYLKCRQQKQEIMIGYSDGGKDGGIIAAHWKLYKAQQEIYYIAEPYGINVKFFHGRGGSLGRGGGPLKRTLLAQPTELFGKNVKITEQGEVLSSRYLLPTIAYLNLKEAATTLLKAAIEYGEGTQTQSSSVKQWESALENISTLTLEKYKEIVFKNKDFFNFFKEATPLMEIGELQIGSRPMSRKNRDRFEDLRAIPWVFAWSQCRLLFPAWYGAGTGFAEFVEQKEENLILLQQMYDEWPFFRTMVQNLNIAIAMSNLTTTKEYINLVKDKEIACRIFETIVDDYNRLKEILPNIMRQEQEHNLKQVSSIDEWINRRNPYLHVLHFIQVELLKQSRSSEVRDEELLKDILLTISGIASGIRNTG